MKMYRTVMIVSLLVLSACSSMSEKSHSIFADKVVGIDHFDTQTSEEKAQEKWFDSYYSDKHCGVWEGTCSE